MKSFARTLIISLLSVSLLVVSETGLSAEHPELKAFPAAQEGKNRFVIVLPQKPKEDAFQVEIIPGKVMMTDGVNLMRLGTIVEPRTLMGWGYTYYEVNGSDVAMSTMMAPPEGGQPVERFVAGTSLLVRYNSRLPIVIYAPEGIEIHYRIWKAADMTETAARK